MLLTYRLVGALLPVWQALSTLSITVLRLQNRLEFRQLLCHRCSNRFPTELPRAAGPGSQSLSSTSRRRGGCGAGGGGVAGDLCAWTKRQCETCGTMLRCSKHEKHRMQTCREVFWSKHGADGTRVRTLASFCGAQTSCLPELRGREGGSCVI